MCCCSVSGSVEMVFDETEALSIGFNSKVKQIFLLILSKKLSLGFAEWPQRPYSFLQLLKETSFVLIKIRQG